MEQQIKDRLRDIEREHQVTILLAVESGSRAWGFASTNSDWDVRFIYVRQLKDYLSIDEKRDVIELPIVDDLDINGWDLKKALQLLRKSNPPLLEWLQSPLIYFEHAGGVARQMRELAKAFYSPRSSYYHYLHMARGNLREYLSGEEVWLKKYFYVLRPLLAMRWINLDLGMVPMEFQLMLEATVEPGLLRSAIEGLLAMKRAGEELDMGQRIPAISDFVEQEIARLGDLADELPVQKGDTALLDRCFRNAVMGIWNDE